MIEQKIKLVILSYSALMPRQLDWLNLDDLQYTFDLEFWDCSDICARAVYGDWNIERSYAFKINTLKEFRDRLSLLPRDTVIIEWGVYNGEIRAYKFHNVLSSFFTNLCRIYFEVFIPHVEQHAQCDNDCCVRAIEKESLLIRGKRILRKYLRLLKLVLVHPIDAIAEYKKHKFQKTIAQYKLYEISAVKGAKHHINHPNYDTYMRNKLTHTEHNERYILYIDSYFPYHPEYPTSSDINQIAKVHFKKLNAFFDRVEKYYDCRVIIAAHPIADYRDNPFGGREICYDNSERLIAGSIACLQHGSCALSYVMLHNKPVALLLDEEMKCNQRWIKAVETYHNKYNIELKYIDDLSVSPEIPILPNGMRDVFIKEMYGDVDESHYEYNKDLLKKNLIEIYHEMYG